MRDDLLSELQQLEYTYRNGRLEASADLFAEARQAIEGLVKERDALRKRIRDWQFKAKREAHTGHVCDASNVCDALAQSMNEALKEPR